MEQLWCSNGGSCWISGHSQSTGPTGRLPWILFSTCNGPFNGRNGRHGWDGCIYVYGKGLIYPLVLPLHTLCVRDGRVRNLDDAQQYTSNLCLQRSRLRREPAQLYVFDTLFLSLAACSSILLMSTFVFGRRSAERVCVLYRILRAGSAGRRL